jgi:hypothetical protein
MPFSFCFFATYVQLDVLRADKLLQVLQVGLQLSSAFSIEFGYANQFQNVGWDIPQFFPQSLNPSRQVSHQAFADQLFISMNIQED